ncbi:hypothetical protein [Catenuloplanes atrovinosus]|uniref:Ni,Fe-hydrogenase I cytochrome b subunit n=1 Tax=Catenuloplanes atrovinosus TaxID=137266 RepID=A0AAE3YLT2_9ACTN|nr:hypothetical protein [Catenuloplanes atrovinosus]MDR7274524.1 Ni,Fe-hydrogenase I cytochrome b subunit [Catenuloplanes atrovinosus]
MHPITLITTGVTVLTVVTIAFGGTFVLRVVTGGQPANDLQRSFFRAGHAHAGVLVTLGLVCALLLETGGADGALRWSYLGVLAAAVLIPAGFFLSVLGRDPARPGPPIALLWAGAAVLTLGLLLTGTALIATGLTAA